MEKKETILRTAWKAGICVCLLFGLGACLDGEDHEGVDEYRAADLNRDQRVDTREFSSLVGYDDWDDNNDGNVDYNEFYDYNYGLWDEDDDGIVNQDEWNIRATEDTRNDGTDMYGNWEDWDTDKNGQLDEEEFRERSDRINPLRNWDGDRNDLVDEKEFREGLFNAWDKNRDGYLEEEEYTDGYSSYFGS